MALAQCTASVAVKPAPNWSRVFVQLSLAASHGVNKSKPPCLPACLLFLPKQQKGSPSVHLEASGEEEASRKAVLQFGLVCWLASYCCFGFFPSTAILFAGQYIWVEHFSLNYSVVFRLLSILLLLLFLFLSSSFVFAIRHSHSPLIATPVMAYVHGRDKNVLHACICIIVSVINGSHYAYQRRNQEKTFRLKFKAL